MAEMKFEDALKKLEKIVDDMEKGELSLDEAMKKYEEGVRLSKVCSKKLEEAERKVEILIRSETGELKAQPFEEVRGGNDSVCKKKEAPDRGGPKSLFET